MRLDWGSNVSTVSTVIDSNLKLIGIPYAHTNQSALRCNHSTTRVSKARPNMYADSSAAKSVGQQGATATASRSTCHHASVAPGPA